MNLKDLLPAAMVVVVAGIGISIGAEVLEDIQGNYNSTSDSLGERMASQTSGNATEGLAEMAEWFPTIGLVVAAAIVLGLLLVAFYFGRR